MCVKQYKADDPNGFLWVSYSSRGVIYSLGNPPARRGSAHTAQLAPPLADRDMESPPLGRRTPEGPPVADGGLRSRANVSR